MSPRQVVCCVAVALLVAFVGCQTAPGSLDVSLQPKTAVGDAEVTATVRATNADGTVGIGTVQVTTSAGSLKDGVTLTLDGFGIAVAKFTCDVRVEAKCDGARVAARWTPKGGQLVTTEATLKVDAGTGVGGGSGGGSGGAGGGVGAGGGAGSALYIIGAVGPVCGGPNQISGIAPLGEPTTARWGFPCGAIGEGLMEPRNAQFRPDGGLLYMTGTGGGSWVAQWEPDQAVPDSNGTCQYPEGSANDLLIDTSPCGSNSGLAFWVRPDTGSVVYRCYGAFYESGQLVPALAALSNINLIDVGYGGRYLVQQRPAGPWFLVDDRNIQSPTNPEVSGMHGGIRATPQGFFAVKWAGCSQVFVRYDGTTVSRGEYANSVFSGLCQGTLDTDGTMYELVTEAPIRVLRRPLRPAAASVVYTAENAPADDWSSCPPTVYVKPRGVIVAP